jgi:hypothetical protein
MAGGEETVGVFDLYELNVLQFGVVPLKGDSPRGFSGVRVNGTSIMTPE